MPARLSRRKLATYVAEKLLGDVAAKTALRELAAYLVDTGRTRETELIIREIEDILASRGMVVAEVISARPLTDELRAEISKTLGAKHVQLREKVDESLLGGVRIDLPGKRFDGTMRHKLNALRAKQV